MKKILLSFTLLACAFLNKTQAQCSISNVSVATTSFNQTNCQVTFNLSYTADVNPGAKYVVVYLWKSQDYVTHAASEYPLATSKTGNLAGTLVISDPGGTPSLMTTWPADMKKNTTPSTPILTGTLDVSTNANGTRTYAFTGITTTLNGGCLSQVNLKGDVWATQNSQNSSCLAAGAINVTVNDPVMRGGLFCTKPLSFNISFNTLAVETITFSAYNDANQNGIFDQADMTAGKLNLSGGSISGTATDVTVITAQNSSAFYGPYNFTLPGGATTSGIFVVATVAGNTYDNVLLLSNACATLPVSFKAFTAARTNASNTLRWTTATEINNKGFYVQRFYNGQWQNLGFTATKAEGGNSSSDLNYTFNDVFNFKGVVQYRIMQVDIDGQSKFSQVRSLSNAGTETSSLLIYPNPAPANGNVSLVLADASSFYDIQVIDNSGRVIKEFAAVRSTQQVSGLPKGQYLARAKDRNSGQVSVEKFMVQ
ncbi:MAG: T9SS type A sorting domain-containing protein [Flavisolibacter sp.]